MTGEMSFAEFVAWNRARRVAEGQLVKPGEGYQERIAVPATTRPPMVTRLVLPDKGGYGSVDFRVALVRERSLRLMRGREMEIEIGEYHRTPAMKGELANLAAHVYGD